jgi:cell division protein FtsB
MPGTHKTTAIARPDVGATATIDRTPPRRRDPTIFDELTRPTRAEHRLVTSRSNRWVIGLLGVAVLGALLAALFVLPVQSWRRQQDQIALKEQELSVLTDANEQLAADVQHLQTVEGAREAARDELGLIDRGEERISVSPPTDAALPLPTGWPYDAVLQIAAVRLAPAVTAPPATTSAATTPVTPAVATTAVVASVAPVEQAPVPAAPDTSIAPTTTVAA